MPSVEGRALVRFCRSLLKPYLAKIKVTPESTLELRRKSNKLVDELAKWQKKHHLFPAGPVHVGTVEESGGVKGELLSTNTQSQAGKPRPTIMYLHGGAYVLGNPLFARGITLNLCKRTGMDVMSVDYPLAPEHPFPAALEAAVSTYQWLLNRGIPASEIVIGGDSAGGNLTVATLLSITQRKLPVPLAGLCLSPWLDLTGTGPRQPNDAFIPDTPEAEAAFVRMVTGDATATTDPLVSPVYAPDDLLRRLPPLCVHVSSTEALYQDSLRFSTNVSSAQGVPLRRAAVDFAPRAARFFWQKDTEAREGLSGDEVALLESILAQTGTDSVDGVCLVEFEGMPHVHHAADFLPESRVAIAHFASFIDHARRRQRQEAFPPPMQ